MEVGIPSKKNTLTKLKKKKQFVHDGVVGKKQKQNIQIWNVLN